MHFISTVEEEFKGKEVNYNAFSDIFEPNGYQGLDKLEFRFYIAEPEDEKALFSSYEIDDPRAFDLADDDEDTDTEEYDEDFATSIEDYPYPNISVYVNLAKVGEAYVIKNIDICKVYPSVWPRAGFHASSFTDFEAEYVTKRLKPILKS